MPGAITPLPIEAELVTADPFLPSWWYPKFSEHVETSRIVQLSPQFVTLLSSGSVYLPDLPNASATTDLEWSDGTVETQTTSSNISATAGNVADEAAIESAIGELGGAVCPKLNTACPTDAVWANIHRSTRCTTVDDVLTLIQASERALRTLPSSPSHACLFLRKWENDFDPRQSFRLFVYSQNLVAVAHRSTDGLAVAFPSARSDDIVQKLASWFTSVVQTEFTESNNYVVDARLDRTDEVMLVDFAPWRQADPLHFQWDELEEASWLRVTGHPQFRASVREGVAPSQSAYDALPVELRGTEGMVELASAAQRLVAGQRQGASVGSANENDETDANE